MLVYNGDGNRVSESVGGTTTKYLIDNLNPTGLPQVLDETVSGTVTRTYAYGLQRTSENQKVGSTWTPSFYGYDGHGNVRFLTSKTGAITDSYDYDAFGMPIRTSGSTANLFLYSGERLDSNVGLYDLRARYYNQATGRFWTMDPRQDKLCCRSRPCPSAASDTYAYGDNNPVNRVDPAGQEAIAEYAINLRFAVLATATLYVLARDIRCVEQLDKCIDQCIDELKNGEWPFRKCIADCMAAAGCDYTIPVPWYTPPPR